MKPGKMSQLFYIEVGEYPRAPIAVGMTKHVNFSEVDEKVVEIGNDSKVGEAAQKAEVN
jgi:hypothetical protein